MNQNIFIGGAWPYANSSLHVGHIAALLPGDVIARYYRKNDDNVLYVSGSDSHGTPITLRARKEHRDPIDIVNHYHNEFCECFKKLHFTYDKYTFTCSEYHKSFVRDCINKIYDNGYIYKKEEFQDFCENCNQFLTDREVEGTCPICGGHATGEQCDNCMTTFNSNELKDKHCKYCGQPVSSRTSKHLYWKLSAFQREIEEFVTSHEDIWRFNAINESKKYLDEGLKDRVITRELEWGIDIPISGFEDKKVYVWIEAVLGYISAGKLYCEENGLDWNTFYKNSSVKSYYIHGKDNIPFHTIIYPALLLSLDEGYHLPDCIISSEYLNVNDEKISKRKGNGATVKELLGMYDADTIRYYMIYQAPEKRDSNFNCEHVTLVHNKKLVGEYGNFVNRNLAFLVKKFDGITPAGIVDHDVKSVILKTYDIVGSSIRKGELKYALTRIQELVQFANKYYDEHKPWVTVNENVTDFNNTTATCLELIINIANLYEPFIPDSSHKIFSFFHQTDNSWKYIEVKPFTKLHCVSIIFSRI